MNILQKTIGHFMTITRHRHKVILYCAKTGILWQGMRHDLSKYSITEFVPGVRYYTGTRSPNEGERQEHGYSLAWMHHKGRNRHHFEYWTDYNLKSHKTEPVQMPYRYVIEMFCDRVAASRIYNGNTYTDECPLAYFEKRKDQRLMHDETSKQLEELLVMLAEQGEKNTFKYIKNSFREKTRDRQSE